MIKLLVILINAAVVVDSCVDRKFVDSSGLDERTVYGWKVQISSGLSSGNACYGIFIGPRVFLTHSECVENNGMFNSIEITNSIYNSKVVQTQFTVSHSNIYTGYNLKKKKIVFYRKVAFLIINEPVIPANETTANSFVKLAEDIEDVDLLNCFMPEVPTPPIIVKNFCQMRSTVIDKSAQDFSCYHNSIEEWHGSGLFCQLKKNPNVNVLAGYVGSNFKHFLGYFDSSQTVINLTGLNIKVMNL